MKVLCCSTCIAVNICHSFESRTWINLFYNFLSFLPWTLCLIFTHVTTIKKISIHTYRLIQQLFLTWKSIKVFKSRTFFSVWKNNQFSSAGRLKSNQNRQCLLDCIKQHNKFSTRKYVMAIPSGFFIWKVDPL